MPLEMCSYVLINLIQTFLLANTSNLCDYVWRSCDIFDDTVYNVYTVTCKKINTTNKSMFHWKLRTEHVRHMNFEELSNSSKLKKEKLLIDSVRKRVFMRVQSQRPTHRQQVVLLKIVISHTYMGDNLHTNLTWRTTARHHTNNAMIQG